MDPVSQLLASLLAAAGTASAYQQQMQRVNQKPMSHYTTVFMAQAPHLKDADVTAYRNYVLKHGPFIDVPDVPKCNKQAAKVRQVSNRLYLNREYKAALEKYNESICWAENGSEDLGIGYANRSAIYYDEGEYELSLVNIGLAKQHNYPERLMPKLLARELNCKEKINNGQSKGTTACPKLAMHLETNPKIPFLAAGIVMKHIPDYGRSLVAERDFQPGDVLLQEKAMIASASPELKYKNCSLCSVENFHSLIPCPKCVSVMYCSQECLDKAFKVGHRFECGITEKLHHVSYGSSRIYLGSRMFFYALSLFNDNLKEMMEYCEANGRTGSNPFDLDYTNYDPLEEFKAFHTAKLPTKKFLYEDSFRFYAAVYYSIYIGHPLVKSIFTSKPQKDFMLRTILDYMRIIGFQVIGPRQNFTNQLYSLASICNHSCDPNTLTAAHFDHLKLIVLQPIRKGSQILVSYGPLYGEHSDVERRHSMGMLHFDCHCVACNPVKLRARQMAAERMIAPIPRKHILSVEKVMKNDEVDDTGKLNILQQFVEQYSLARFRQDYDLVLELYRSLLLKMGTDEAQALLRAKAADAI